MTYAPKISIVKDNLIDREASIFLGFLNNSQFPQNRRFIFKAFPSLDERISRGEDEKEAVYSFVKSFYEDHDKEIKTIITEAEKNIADNSSLAIEELSRVMEASWDMPVSYEAIPTILPFSPFNEREKNFRFSILSKVLGKSSKDVLYIACHEISHFIFFDLLTKFSLSIENDLKHYLKESLVVLALNQDTLRTILKLENYKGNPEVHGIFIEKDERVLSLVDYLFESYKNEKSFGSLLKQIIKEMSPVSQDFSQKRSFWNKYGNDIYGSPELADQYNTPIKI